MFPYSSQGKIIFHLASKTAHPPVTENLVINILEDKLSHIPIDTGKMKRLVTDFRIPKEKITLESEGSFIDAELIIKADKLGFNLHQIGVDFFPRLEGVSTLSSPSVILKIIKEMCTFWYSLYIKKKID